MAAEANDDCGKAPATVDDEEQGGAPTSTSSYPSTIDDIKADQQRLQDDVPSGKAGMDRPLKEQAVVTDPDLPIFDIMPIPSEVNDDTVPGAHAVGGLPRCFRGMGGQHHAGALSRPASDHLSSEDNIEHIIEEAVVVQEEEEDQMEDQNEEVIDAQMLPECNASGRQKPSKLWTWLGLFLLIALLGGVIPALVVLKPEDSLASSEGRQHVQETLDQPFQEGLSSQTLNNIQDTASAQYLANLWMLQDPNLDAYTPERKLQRFHLVTTYFATNGDDWFRNDNWLSYNVSECDWWYTSSPLCDPNDSLLRHFDLSSNNLTGTFPFEYGYLLSLESFDISNNKIQGPIPIWVIRDPENLKVFLVSNNKFDGGLLGGGGYYEPFPLEVIKLDGNQVKGEVGMIFLVLPHLRIINITGNLFEGQINAFIGSCKNLTHIGYGENLLSGTIPSIFGDLPLLQELDLSGNVNLNGTIPPQLGNLTILSHLDISDTSVWGEVPAPLCEGAEITVSADCSMVQCCD